MKKLLLALTAAVTLLAAAPASATGYDRSDAPAQNRPNDRDNNYGFDKNHKVTPEERKRWEEQHKNDKRDGRANKGFDKNRKMTPEERKRWEEQHKNDHDDDHH